MQSTPPNSANALLTSLPEHSEALFTAHVEVFDGDTLSFEAPASLPLLQAALLAGIELPSSCRNGTCRTCICQLRDGKVLYRIEWPGLSAEEKQAGYILPCVAYPASDVVINWPA